MFLLPVYLLLFLVGGCSYKYMDPQYYEFKKLCKDIDNKVIIYNKVYWELYSNREKGNTMHDEKGEFFFNQKINKKIYFDFKKSESINVLQKNKFTLTEVTFEDYYDGIHYSTHLSYIYNDYGIFLGGDEGAGFYFRYHKRLYCEDIR